MSALILEHCSYLDDESLLLVKDANAPRNTWLLARVTSTNKDDQGLVRSATVQTSSGSRIDRPVNKLVLLVENPET